MSQPCTARKISWHIKTPPSPLWFPQAPPASVPQPLTASGNRECHFPKYTSLLRGKGPISCGYTEIQPQELRVTERDQEVLTPKDQRLCFLLLLNQLPAWSSLCSVMWHGSDDWGTVKRSQMPANLGWVQPRRKAPSLDSKIKKLCLKDTANDPRKSAGRKWFSSVPGQSYKNKNWRGGGSGGKLK